MRPHLAALALLGLSASLAACQTAPKPVSSATEGTRWVSPTGTWSIDAVSQGWFSAGPLPTELEYLAAVLVPFGAVPAGEARGCGVFEESIGPAPDAATVRRLAGQLNVTIVNDLFDPASQGLRVTAVRTFVLDRVTVAEISATSDDGTRIYLHRLFFLPRNGEAIAVEVGCFWAATADPAKAAEVRAVLDTMAIR